MRTVATIIGYELHVIVTGTAPDLKKVVWNEKWATIAPRGAT